MTISPAFYRSVAVCSIVSAITTLGLIYLPEFYQPVEGFEGRMRRVDDPAYVLRSWVYLVHPFITFAAALGVALRIRTLRPVAAIIGVAGFALWANWCRERKAAESQQCSKKIVAVLTFKRFSLPAPELPESRSRHATIDHAHYARRG